MESLTYKEVMNDPMLWLMCIPAVLMAVIQAVLFSVKAAKAGPNVGLSKEEAWKAFRTGAVASVGPALSSVVVMISLMAAVGGAFAWLRLCFIGSATTELTAASLGAKAMAVELGGEGYDITAFANSVWACSLNALGWLLVAAFFTPRLSDIKKKIVGDNTELLSLVSASAMVGAFSYMSMGECLKGGSYLMIFIFSVCLMAFLTYLSMKYTKLKEHLLSIVLISALVFACALISRGIN